jgi:hypothetical protein
VVQAVEQLPSKLNMHETLSSKPSTTKKEMTKRRKRFTYRYIEEGFRIVKEEFYTWK